LFGGMRSIGDGSCCAVIGVAPQSGAWAVNAL